jgi:hypothetical protein
MSKTLSTEMSVDQLRRHIAERKRQVPDEGLEIEEAELMLQAKLLEQSNDRLNQLTAGLDQLRAELAQMQQALQEGAEAQRGLQGAMRRYARSHSMTTLLLLLATGVVLRVGWVQMEQAGHGFLASSKAPNPPAIDRPVDPAPPRPQPQASVRSPYHMMSGFAMETSPASALAAPNRVEAAPSEPVKTAEAAISTPPKGPVVPEGFRAPEPIALAVIGPAVLGPAPQPAAAAPAAPAAPTIQAALGPSRLGPELPSAPTTAPATLLSPSLVSYAVPVAPAPAAVSSAAAPQPAQATPLTDARDGQSSPGYISIWRSGS